MQIKFSSLSVILLSASFLIYTACSPSHSNSSGESTVSREWPTSTMEAASFNAVGVDSLEAKIGDGKYGYIDQMLIIKAGSIIYNQTFDNNYQEISKGLSGILGCGYESCQDSSEINSYNYYHPSFHPYYQGSRLHSLQSVTKSVAATVVGIALKKGDIPSLENKVLDYFEEYDLSQTDESLKSATLHHLLCMQLGIGWNENTAPLDSNNQVVQMEKSADWIQYVLQQPMDSRPGEKWVYSSGASHLLSGIIKKATGMSMAAYAEQHLFKPLGIETYHWKTTPKGFQDTEGGLYLTAEDLAKIGQLYINGGSWKGQQILSPVYIKEAIKKQVLDLYGDGGKEGYGYQWWLPGDEEEIWAAMGFGNQFLIVIPEQEIIGVIHAWNIYDIEAEYIFRDFVDVLKDSKLEK
ncbi:MAG: beta-lactamase family protein [Saprospiraceae bacterium]|nr:beta-lactamase family protein [Saprospiraceae bacterium]